MTSSTRLRARWLLPNADTILEDGEVVIEDGLITELRHPPVDGRSAHDALDFGDAVILPGLVNAHAHLEYTILRGAVEDLPLFPWLQWLMELKSAIEPEEWAASAIVGAAEMACAGVTAVADCTDSGASARALAVAGLRGVVYQEVFGIQPEPPTDKIISELDNKILLLQAQCSGTAVRIGVSPHSIYTVRPDLLSAVAKFAADRDLPVCIHAAESDAEAELSLTGTGPRARNLADRKIPWDVPGCGVIEYLYRLGVLGPATLVAHCVSLSASDLDAIHASHCSVAHCPRSNAKLGNGAAPLHLLARALSSGNGSAPTVRIQPALGLGTDSAVSSNNVDMFEEMRFALLLHRALRRRADRPTARDVLEMATAGGARALPHGAATGTLAVGGPADLTVVDLRAAGAIPCYHPLTAVVHGASRRDVLLTVGGGRVVARRGSPRCPGLTQARRRMKAASERIRAAWMSRASRSQ